MSDKLKIMQSRICSVQAEVTDLYCASIGYPDLKTLPSEESHANCHDQPEVDESEFDRLVQVAEASKLIA